MINQQPAARSTRQVRSNTNLFVSYVPTRPLALDRQTTTTTESGTTSTTKLAIHTAYIPSESLLGAKKIPNDAIPERMHATGPWFLPWILVYTYDLRVAQLNKRNDFSPCFFVSKMYSLFFGTTSPHAIYEVTSLQI